MRVSVIINTSNRANLLVDCLTSLQQQTYDNFEVVVVVGPSEDNTLEVLAGFRENITITHCNDLNLSQSRNIGIALSTGDICAFIDDDAVAHPDWLTHLVKPYEEFEVGAVGGFTLDHTGTGFQCRYTVCDRLGRAFFFDRIDPSSLTNFAGAPCYPSLLGTNCSFRSKYLKSIGGFDEVFVYMLDETDVCLRLNDDGKKIVTLPEAIVLHRYAPSHNRSPDRIPKSLLAPARSKSYFCMKHRRDANDLTEVTKEIDRFSSEVSFSNRWFIDHKKISAARFLALNTELESGVSEGFALALARLPSMRSHHLDRYPIKASFTRFQKDGLFSRLRLCLVSQGYPPRETAGIARWTHALATALARLGHYVHVICASTGDQTLEYSEGVWIHKVPAEVAVSAPASPVSLPEGIYNRAAAVYLEAKSIQKMFGLDLLSAPIWDVEGILCAAHLNVPVITSLHTTYKLALPFKHHWLTDLEYRYKHVERIISAEIWLFKHSHMLLANSKAIVCDIEQAYGPYLQLANYKIVPHGVDDQSSEIEKTDFDVRFYPQEKLNVLFVGRLEKRKGIDVLLQSVIRLYEMGYDFCLRVVGEEAYGDQLFEEKIRELNAVLASRNFYDRVSYYGYVDDAELKLHYRCCDIFVAPSRFESFGLIAIEAMRFGKPVVASNAGGLGEIFEDRIEGFLFSTGEPASLTDAMIPLLSAESLRRQVGEAARARFLRDYTTEAMATQASTVYRQCLNSE